MRYKIRMGVFSSVQSEEDGFIALKREERRV